MQCKQCSTENPESNRFCGSCGARLVPAPVPVPNDPGAFYCARHKTVSTRVRCSRCETPICPKCMVPGAVGYVCRSCAHERTPIRWRGVVHEAGKGLADGAPAAGRALWYLALWTMVLSVIRGLFGGRDS